MMVISKRQTVSNQNRKETVEKSQSSRPQTEEQEARYAVSDLIKNGFKGIKNPDVQKRKKLARSIDDAKNSSLFTYLFD